MRCLVLRCQRRHAAAPLLAQREVLARRNEYARGAQIAARVLRDASASAKRAQQAAVSDIDASHYTRNGDHTRIIATHVLLFDYCHGKICCSIYGVQARE